MKQLTQKQQQFLAFLRSHIETHGTFPTYREMKAALKTRSPNGPRQKLIELERKGYLERTGSGWVLGRMSHTCPGCGQRIERRAA